jgi:hypothetical protein
MRKWTKRIGLSLASLVLCSALATTVLTASTHLPGNQTTPAGFRQYSSVYVKMRDGVEIAVAIMLPPDLRPNERVSSGASGGNRVVEYSPAEVAGCRSAHAATSPRSDGAQTRIGWGLRLMMDKLRRARWTNFRSSGH